MNLGIQELTQEGFLIKLQGSLMEKTKKQGKEQKKVWNKDKIGDYRGNDLKTKQE